MSGEKNLQARTIFCIYPRSGFSSTTCFREKARFPGPGTRLHCDGTKRLGQEAMLVHEKATSFCGKSTLLFEKPIWFCANVMLQCEKPILLYTKAMYRRSVKRYPIEGGGLPRDKTN